MTGKVLFSIILTQIFSNSIWYNTMYDDILFPEVGILVTVISSLVMVIITCAYIKKEW